MAISPHRFVVLDSWRGICALMVTLYHLNAYSVVKELPFFNNAYLFVDFFFVLSGFVIATNYQTRLGQGFGLKKFMLLRFGRLYPLYFALLVCFFMTELFFSGGTPFASPQKSLSAAFANIFLLQCFGYFQFDTWNWPGWSIATEFWTCLLFAIIATRWPQKLNFVLSISIVVCLLILILLSPTGINVTYNFGMLRSIFGFSVGVMVFALWQKVSTYHMDERLAFVVEVFGVLFVFIFVTAVAQSKYSLFAPFVFAAVVFVFAAEAGPISGLLKQRIFVNLGTLSYSVYLIHLFVGRMLVGAANNIETLSGHQLISRVPHEGEIIDVLGLNFAQGNMWAILYLILVVAAAALTYNYIEVPSRRWFRRLAQAERP